MICTVRCIPAMQLGVHVDIVESAAQSRWLIESILSNPFGDKFRMRSPGCKHTTTHLDVACLLRDLENCASDTDTFRSQIPIRPANGSDTEFRSSGKCVDDGEICSLGSL